MMLNSGTPWCQINEDNRLLLKVHGECTGRLNGYLDENHVGETEVVCLPNPSFDCHVKRFGTKHHIEPVLGLCKPGYRRYAEHLACQ